VLRGTYVYPPRTHVLNIFKTESQGDFTDCEKELLGLVGKIFSSSISRYSQHLKSRDFVSLFDRETEKTGRILAIIDDKKQQIYCSHLFAEKISGIFGSSAISDSMNKFYAIAENRTGDSIRLLKRDTRIAFGGYDFEISPQYVYNEEGQHKYFFITITEGGAMEPKRARIPADENYNFTPRESEIAKLLLRGLDNGQIAEELYLNTSTVKFHIGNIYEKLGVRNRVSAIAKLTE
jgi:DNA-binding CsgD family transcriptional regulator